MCARRWQAATGLLVALGVLHAAQRPIAAQPPPDADWQANAVVENPAAVSDPALGAAQGVSFAHGRLYFYGDAYQAQPRIGIIREYTLDLKPTGREIRLTHHGHPLLTHPTGLTWDDEHGCFLGDTVHRMATIYQLDWPKALRDGNLDAAVLAVIRDDLAVNGCRPLFVALQGRRLLATADYGDVQPAVRLYEPRGLVAAQRSSAPGVCVASIACGAFNQNLAWDAATGRLTCVENVIAGRGWKLDAFDLAKAVTGGCRLDTARVQTLVYPPHSELQGWLRLPDGRELFVTSSRQENIYQGSSRPLAQPVSSPQGARGPDGRR